MSGICGFCNSDRGSKGIAVSRMLAQLHLGGGRTLSSITGEGFEFGVASKWPAQSLGTIEYVSVAFSGDLVNLSSLEMEYGVAGDSAAAIVAKTYLRFGDAFVEKLEGAFSLALWDANTRRLILAIDRLGINSLYWKSSDGSLCFGSRVSAIKAAFPEEPEVNQAAIMQYLLFSNVPAPLTAYKGIQKLEPGKMLIWQSAEIRVKQYWDIQYEEDSAPSVEKWAEKVREGIRRAVHGQASGVSPDRLGAFLSGGTDSSSVAAFLSEIHKPVSTYSIAFDEDAYNEGGFAKCTSDKFQTDQHLQVLTPGDARDAISKIVSYFDEPFANSSAIGGYYCALLARNTGKDVLLAGDGGDEIFGGNSRYADDKRFSMYFRIPRWIRHGFVEPLASLVPAESPKLGLPARYIRRANVPLPRRIFSYHYFLSTPATEVFDGEFLANAPVEHWCDIADSHFHSAKASSELNRYLYMDMKMTLADNDLRKVVGTAELADMQVRFPFLDHRLVELAATIPSELKVHGFELRYLFKQAMRGILPDQVLFKKKHGFGVPIALWFLKDKKLSTLLDDVLHDQSTLQRGYFSAAFIRKLREMHATEHAAYYGEILWYLLVLELWHREHVSSEREVTASGRA